MIKCEIDNLNTDKSDLRLTNTAGSNDTECWSAESLIDQWDSINWNQVERYVFKLQQRIYRARDNNNHRMVHKLQRMLINSMSCTLLAIRRATLQNRGKRTAGVDREIVLTDAQRMQLAKRIHKK